MSNHMALRILFTSGELTLEDLGRHPRCAPLVVGHVRLQLAGGAKVADLGRNSIDI